MSIISDWITEQVGDPWRSFSLFDIGFNNRIIYSGLKQRDIRRLKTAQMKSMRRTAGYTVHRSQNKWSCFRRPQNRTIRKEINI